MELIGDNDVELFVVVLVVDAVVELADVLLDVVEKSRWLWPRLNGERREESTGPDVASLIVYLRFPRGTQAVRSLPTGTMDQYRQTRTLVESAQEGNCRHEAGGWKGSNA